MAFREIEAPTVEQGNYKKFEAIGDKLAGVFVSYAAVEKTFDGESKTQNQYTFKNKDGSWIVTANYSLHAQLQKAELQPGYKAIITYTSDLPPTKPGYSPMKMFKVLVDDGASEF